MVRNTITPNRSIDACSLTLSVRVGNNEATLQVTKVLHQKCYIMLVHYVSQRHAVLGCICYIHVHTSNSFCGGFGGTTYCNTYMLCPQTRHQGVASSIGLVLRQAPQLASLFLYIFAIHYTHSRMFDVENLCDHIIINPYNSTYRKNISGTPK